MNNQVEDEEYIVKFEINPIFAFMRGIMALIDFFESREGIYFFVAWVQFIVSAVAFTAVAIYATVVSFGHAHIGALVLFGVTVGAVTAGFVLMLEYSVPMFLHRFVGRGWLNAILSVVDGVYNLHKYGRPLYGEGVSWRYGRDERGEYYERKTPHGFIPPDAFQSRADAVYPPPCVPKREYMKPISYEELYGFGEPVEPPALPARRIIEKDHRTIDGLKWSPIKTEYLR
ncbi:MAG: hypothetical protein DRP64_19080 [Verrucomicrobia bacterium]|nr:MAG: hypothetical protein DRP64_19080 [Verrucomicrobiota bacterium]